jgi:hypothetical protein
METILEEPPGQTNPLEMNITTGKGAGKGNFRKICRWPRPAPFRARGNEGKNSIGLAVKLHG